MTEENAGNRTLETHAIPDPVKSDLVVTLVITALPEHACEVYQEMIHTGIPVRISIGDISWPVPKDAIISIMISP